jgi:asparagine synthase (glutamine-hydrolysing)
MVAWPGLRTSLGNMVSHGMLKYHSLSSRRVSDAESLARALRVAIIGMCDEGEAAILFSGGLDSTVVARLASEVCEVKLYTVGVKGAHDLMVSEATARELDLGWEPILVEEEEIISALPELARTISCQDALPLSFEMPLWIGASRAKERTILTGQGADELFGGYARYLRMAPEELISCMEKDQEALLQVGVQRENRIATRFLKEFRYPYLHPDLVRLARSFPAEDFIHEGERKVVLRQVAMLLGLRDAASRPKKAAQYGSGIMKAMRAEARRRGIELNCLMPALVQESETV